MSGIENAFLAQVQADVQKDRVDRDHDVFLSHTSDDRDIEVSTDLYAELTGRGYQNLDRPPFWTPRPFRTTHSSSGLGGGGRTRRTRARG